MDISIVYSCTLQRRVEHFPGFLHKFNLCYFNSE